MKEDMEAHGRIDQLESEIAKDRSERQECEWNRKRTRKYRTRRN